MTKFSWKQRVLIIPPLLLGWALLVFAPTMKAEPPTVDKPTGKKVVRALKVMPRKIQPAAVGYGLTAPADYWEAQTEVDGTVVWVSDTFKDGSIFKQGDEILRLDPSYYELNIARREAELEVLKLSYQSTLESLKIAEQEHELKKSEYDRIVRLNKAKAVSDNEKDRVARELLGDKQQLQTLTNTLAINKAQQQVLQTELAQAERDLENTIISAPFDLRITAKLVGFAEYVNKGEIILTADGIAATEVSAQFPTGKLRPLRKNAEKTSGDNPAGNRLENELEATVAMKVGDYIVSWDAEVDRSGGKIDAQTQSQSVIVRIENPYAQAEPGKKPPLLRDTFVKVILKAPVLKNQILLPISAIHNDNVYLVKEGKLEIRPIKVDFVQDQIAIVKSGVEAGDIVVMSMLSPAVEGMPLKPQPDKKMMKWLDEETGFKSGNPKQSEKKS